jgi:NADH dehydrogenase
MVFLVQEVCVTKLVTVFGGTGFIGRYVVQMLAARGWRVRAAVRNPNLALFLKPLGTLGQVQLVQANVRFPQSVAAAVAGADAVVNLVGILGESGKQRFDTVQRDGAAAIARAAATAGVSQMVQLSAIGANAESWIAYQRTKGEAEQLVRQVIPGAVILRPSIVFGPEDQFFNRFGSIASLPTLMMPILPVICGDTKFQPVYVKDVAAAVVEALANPVHAGQTYELGGPARYSFRDLLDYIKAQTRSRKPLLEIPLGIAKIQAAVLGLLPNAPLTSDQLAMLQSDNVVTGTDGLDAMGLTPTPMEAVVPAMLARYRPRGQFAPKRAS